MKVISSLSLMASAGVFLFPVSASANVINGDFNATATIEARAIWPWKSGPNAKLFCGPHYVDGSHAREFAFKDLIRQCKQNQRKIKKKEQVALFGKYLTTVAYFCNFSKDGSACNVDELKNALGYVQQDCKNNEGGHVLQVGEVHLKGWKKAYGFTNDLDSIPPCSKKGEHWGLGSKVDIKVPPKNGDDDSDDDDYKPPRPKKTPSSKKNKKKNKKPVYDSDSDDE